MNKRLAVTGSILGLISIILGAFAAHGLESLLDIESINSFETGVRYQMYHAILLLVLANSTQLNERSKNFVFYLVLIGTICFSGSIYGLATNSLSAFDFTSIALITPLGGLLLILAWVLMLVGFFKSTSDKFKSL